MRLISILGIILTLCTTGCKHKVNQSGNPEKNETQEVESLFPITFDTEKEYPEKKINLEDIADLSYVLLESTPNNLLGTIQEVFITENDIFINNNYNHISRFSRKGKFLNTIGKQGHGPGEYTKVFRFQVDTNKQEVYLWASLLSKIFIFDYEGNFKRDFNLGVTCHSFVILDSNHILASMILNYTDTYLEIPPFKEISSIDGTSVRDYLSVSTTDPFIHHPLRVFRVQMKEVKSYKNEYILIHYSKDTIYTLTQERQVSPRYIKTPSNLSLGKFRWFYGLINETTKFAIINLYRQQSYEMGENKFIYIDKLTGNVYNYKIQATNYYSDAIPLGETISIHYLRSCGLTDFSYQCIQPYNLLPLLKENKLSGELQKLAEQMTENSNPVLMLVKFK